VKSSFQESMAFSPDDWTMRRWLPCEMALGLNQRDTDARHTKG